ncbi:hypothetical protein L228DRAFT_104417 [Xylona heveae TC161]|uniref:Fms interacting protein n=1 Tax=Xylona heveae (strain CBS 132557 / TC161) TaxID=1328760 RepID=A0A165IF11_XYLHT|nr:hypothetical protein L228DRAFT_104417 [Xylona heveae TC161]KZF24802.1 hypothetical protein L228DRAFT_104417 [Xylona heveae TC161]
MATTDIVSDPFLRSVLDVSTHTREQCMRLLDLADANPTPADAETASTDVHLQLSQQQKVLYSHLAQLRGLNRNAILGVRQTKQATAEARQEIDKLHLQLQNLYYEQNHLRGEIHACESYDHKYRQLPLIPAEEFLQDHPEHANDDESALMIARINHEYAERQALEQARQALLKKKQGLIADNKKRKDNLANLDNDLEKFIDAAKPIQKTFEKEY